MGKPSNKQHEEDDISLKKKNKERTVSTFPVLNNNTRGCLEAKQSSASSGFADSCDENASVQNSKSGMLPPIDSNTSLIGARKSIELVKYDKEKNMEMYRQQKLQQKEKRSTFLEAISKPNSLPPIKSYDGVPEHVNIPLQKSMVMKRQEEQMKREPRKRAKTHTIYKDIKRGDSWELLKAEKIRCVELSKYEEKLEYDRQQKRVKKMSKRDKQSRNRPVGRKNHQKRLGQADDLSDE